MNTYIYIYSYARIFVCLNIYIYVYTCDYILATCLYINPYNYTRVCWYTKIHTILYIYIWEKLEVCTLYVFMYKFTQRFWYQCYVYIMMNTCGDIIYTDFQIFICIIYHWYRYVCLYISLHEFTLMYMYKYVYEKYINV